MFIHLQSAYGCFWISVVEEKQFSPQSFSFWPFEELVIWLFYGVSDKLRRETESLGCRWSWTVILYCKRTVTLHYLLDYKLDGGTGKMGVDVVGWLHYWEIRSPVKLWEGVFHQNNQASRVLLSAGIAMAKSRGIVDLEMIRGK